MLIDQKRAHERILYEKHSGRLNQPGPATQQTLFPLKLEFNTIDAQLLKDIEPELKLLGFDISEFGGNTFVLNGVPTGTENGQEKVILESILEHYKNQSSIGKEHQTERVLMSVVSGLATKYGVALNTEEMEKMVSELFNCNTKEWTPSGKKTYRLLTEQDLQSFL